MPTRALPWLERTVANVSQIVSWSADSVDAETGPLMHRRRSRSGRQAALHVLELGGRGGIHQHSVAMAELAAERTANRVILHTARRRELEPSSGVEVCPCMTWPFGRLKKLKFAASYL